MYLSGKTHQQNDLDCKIYADTQTMEFKRNAEKTNLTHTGSGIFYKTHYAAT